MLPTLKGNTQIANNTLTKTYNNKALALQGLCYLIVVGPLGLEPRTNGL